MKPGETPRNQENQEQYSLAEDLQYVKDTVTIGQLCDMNISILDLRTMDAPTMHDLRARIDKFNADAKAAKTETKSATDTPAEEEGPEIIPPTPAATPEINKADQTHVEDENITPTDQTVVEAQIAADKKEPTSDELAAMSDAELAAYYEKQHANKPEKKKTWTLPRKIGAAALVAITAGMLILNQFGFFQQPKDVGATGGEQPPAYTQNVGEQEISQEFAIVGTDYRNLFLDAEGDDYNPEKESKYAVATPFPEEFRENDDKEGALEEIFNRLCRQPETIASFAYAAGPEYMAQMGISGETAHDMEVSLFEGDNLESAKEGLRSIFQDSITNIEFVEMKGSAYSFYLYAGNEISNDSDDINLARGKVRNYTGDKVIVVTLTNGSKVIFREPCGGTQVLIPGETSDDPGVIIIVDESDPDPDQPDEPGDPGDPGDPDDPDDPGDPGDPGDPDQPIESEPPKGDNAHASDPNLSPEDDGGGKPIIDTDLEDADGDAPITTEEEAREANGESGGQLPGSASGSEAANPGIGGADGSGDDGGSRDGTPLDESQAFNGETTDYAEDLETDAAGNADQQDAATEVDAGGGDGSGTSGNYTDSEEETLVQGGNF